MTTALSPKAPAAGDIRAAKQLLALFPLMGQVWSAAVREGNAGSIGRFKTLGILRRRGPIRAGELASLCGTTPSATTDIIEGLVEDGHVRRVDDPTDRRAVVLALTDQGQVELERIDELMTAAMAKVFDRLSSEQKTRLRSAIADVNEILLDAASKKETRGVR
jgi:DNA-binding MarR family transcriptional regulator